MDIYTATEEAYKKGYREGYYAAKSESGQSSLWGFGSAGDRPCMTCGYRGKATKFCPECGSAMANHHVKNWV